MTRSTGSVSSADLRSAVRRGAILTTLARVPGAPEASPARLTVSPTTMLPRPSSRAFMAVTTWSAVTHRYLPRSTAVTNASTASACAGRRRLRGREPRPALTRTSSSSSPLCLARGAIRGWLAGPGGCVAWAPIRAAKDPQTTPSRRHQRLGPDPPELGEGLADRSRVAHPQTARDQPEHGPRHDQPMVVVAVEVHAGRVQRGGPDPQSVGRLWHFAAELADLVAQRRQPVALVPAQMPDPGELGRRAGQRRSE